MRRSALCAALLAIALGCDLSLSTALAQYTNREEYCSRSNADAPAVVGTLLSSDKDHITLYRENYGELRFRKADFAICKPCANGKTRTEWGLCPSQVCRSGEVQRADGTCGVAPLPGPGQVKCPSESTTRKDCPVPPVVDAATKNCRSVEDLQFLGSGTVGRHALPYLLQAYANAFGFQLSRPYQINAEEDEENNVAIFLLRNESGECFRAIVRSRGSEAAKNQSRAQVRMSSVVFTDEAMKTFAPRLGQESRSEVEQVVALDAVAILAHKSNPINAMSVCDVAKVFAGEAAPDGRRFNVHFRTGESGTSEFFRVILAKCGQTVSQQRAEYNNYDRLIEGVANDPNGIGFAPVAYNTDKVKTLRLTGRCGLGTEPTPFNIKTEDYLLSRRLFLITPEPLDGVFARQFMNFVKADDRADDAMGLPLPRRGGDNDDLDNPATDLKIELEYDNHADSMDTDETREDQPSLRRFHGFISNAKRLSMVFRFEFNSTELDVKANQDIRRLVRFMKKNFDKTAAKPTLLLVGFTDNVGALPMNRVKATQRAEAVLAELEAQGIRRFVKSVEIVGLGEILPVACNDPNDKLGRDKNRRVEVYLR